MNLNPHPDFLAARRYAHPLRSGERLMFETAEGLLEDTNGWPVEVDQVAHWDGDMPVEAFAVSITDPANPTIRNVTAEFTAAVREARKADTHAADETFMLHADFRRTA